MVSETATHIRLCKPQRLARNGVTLLFPADVHLGVRQPGVGIYVECHESTRRRLRGGLVLSDSEGAESKSNLFGVVPIVPSANSAQLFSEVDRRRLGPAAESQCQVIAHHIDKHGRSHQEHADPDTPILMRAFPVGTMVLLTAIALRPSLRVMTLLHFIHCFPAFSKVSPTVSGHRFLNVEVAVDPAAVYPVDQPFMLSCAYSLLRVLAVWNAQLTKSFVAVWIAFIQRPPTQFKMDIQWQYSTQGCSFSTTDRRN